MTTHDQEIVQSRRSFIFAPGLRPELYPKALACGADIVCVELEDGVAPHDKDEAREKTMALFAEPQADDGVERIVRINCVRSAVGLDDVQAILATDTPPPALMLPKVVSPDEIVWLDDLLTERGHDTRLHIIIEMNAGLEAVFDIARASSRIDALFFGGVDMSADLRCKNTWEPLLYARSRVVHAAASVGIDAIDVPYLDLDDLEGMKAQAQLAKELGFSGKGAVHPKQISALNEVFTPSPEEVAKAQKILAAFEAANTGLVVVDGKLIEKPVVREMQRIASVGKRAYLK
ncbi:MAG: CoA ester lyase [Acidiferrobacteraceae bacterium]|nr:CoA ester lyase [Acidiferrobacteraceae bacterium]MBT4394255.1 CoA ester lyase [Acidiferrobacteraceae bacterium]MBT5623901.1 CoA ester lyase [Acidiferrobacteraceae bacterium]MBT5886665.1 CoA ester lyase [Acidiferrobacteraceae bacterium]